MLIKLRTLQVSKNIIGQTQRSVQNVLLVCISTHSFAHYIVHPIKCTNHVMDCITQTSSRGKKLAVASHVCTIQIQVLSSQSLQGGTKVHL